MKQSVIEQDHFLQLIMDNIPQYIFWKDLDSMYLGCNMNFARAAGFDNPAEIVGKSDYDCPWSREESDFYRKVDRRVMDSGQEEVNFEEPQTMVDGRTRWLRTSKIPLRDPAGKIIGILGTYEDITERKEMELELIKNAKTLSSINTNLQKVNDDLESANIDLEQFAYAASHDLQEPLRMVASYVTLMRRRGVSEKDPEVGEYFGFILEGVKRMSKLIKKILLYSRLAKEDIEFGLIRLGELLPDKLKDLAHTIKKTNAQIHIDLPDIPIKCQPDQIGILFHNLISNGIKFNKTESPNISIGYEEKEREWVFFVADNGLGIEPEYADVIFKAFKRLHSRDQFPGSGIGLSICRRIVDLHNGRIWHLPNPLGGTTFYFTLEK